MIGLPNGKFNLFSGLEYDMQIIWRTTSFGGYQVKHSKITYDLRALVYRIKPRGQFGETAYKVLLQGIFY